MLAQLPIQILCSGLSLAVLAGCSLPEPSASFDARDPAARSLAALDAAETRDERSVPELIAMLDSSDPALRLIACRSLRRITGESFGYDVSAPEPERDAAAERWAAWWRARSGDSDGADGAAELH